MTKVDKIIVENQHEKKSLMKKKFVVSSVDNFRIALKEIALWAESEFKISSIPKDKIWIPALCLEEVIANIILHGLQNFPAEITVEIQNPSEREINLTVVDSGQYFDIKSHIAQRKQDQVGGGGIPLIRSLMKIDQTRLEGHNITRMSYRF